MGVNDKNPVGRPTVMTPDVIQKLEYAFSIGCTDTEACHYADISMATLYNYQNENPYFLERKEALKEEPVLLARETVVKALKEPDHAKWYLERKKKSEFAQRSELTGKDGKDLPTPILGSLIKEENVSDNNSDKESSITEQENTSS